jgi:hypothetical protein
MTAVALAEPPGPVALIWYVAVVVGVIVTLPLVGNVPEPTDGVIVTAVALVVCHVSVVLWPAVIVEGLKLRVTVGVWFLVRAALVPHAVKIAKQERTKRARRNLRRTGDDMGPHPRIRAHWIGLNQ